MQIGFLLYLSIAARYGTSAVAAYFIGVTHSRAVVPARLRLQRRRQHHRRPAARRRASRSSAERSGWEANRLAMVADVARRAGDLPASRDRSPQLFIDDPEVVGDAVSFIHVLALAQPLMAADSTLGGALRGAGDTRFPLLTVIFGFYVARLGCAWAAAHVFGARRSSGCGRRCSATT